ncbi:hypothetical protein [Deinococcus humi]|uniref:Lysophospholipase L1-like esterase n=1 Tax=Deinococcus humi TaxID=662880 RepID=A0A7W8JUC2_9DEIO|nr:hypothetical protein [Deinococcus humi]MBB5363100.1 lysophospholipase L1-like esterase [Deinococcus humi]GGO24690.1 hypothetical protein GCM10008949_13860 [Deinococcus humi]
MKVPLQGMTEYQGNPTHATMRVDYLARLEDGVGTAAPAYLEFFAGAEDLADKVWRDDHVRTDAAQLLVTPANAHPVPMRVTETFYYDDRPAVEQTYERWSSPTNLDGTVHDYTQPQKVFSPAGVPLTFQAAADLIGAGGNVLVQVGERLGELNGVLADIEQSQADVSAVLGVASSAVKVSQAVGQLIPVLENLFESAPTEGITLFDTSGSTAAAYGFAIGPRAPFEQFTVSLKPHGGRLTTLRLLLRNTNKAGAVLYDKTYIVDVADGALQRIPLVLTQLTGDGTIPLWAELRGNVPIGISYAINTLFPTSGGYPAFAYTNVTTPAVLSPLTDFGGGQASYTPWFQTVKRNFDAGSVGPTASWLALMNTAMSNPVSLLPRFGLLESAMAAQVGNDTLPYDTAYDVLVAAVNNNYGFGFPVGVRQGFNLVEFAIVAFQAIKIPTFVKVRFRENDSAGAILGETQVFINPRLGIRKTVRALFPAVILNAAGLPLWLEFTADGFLGYVGQYGTIGQPYAAPLAKYINVALASPQLANGASYPTSVFAAQGTLWARFGTASTTLKGFAPTGELASAVQAMFDTNAYWRPALNLTTLYAAEGVPCEVFFQNILRGPGDYTDYAFDLFSPSFTQVDSNVHYGNRHWSWTPTTAQAAAGDKTLTLNIRRNGVDLVTASIPIRVSPLSRGTSTPRKVLAIADSLTDHGRYMSRFLWRTQQAGDPLDVVSLGTRAGSVPWTTDVGLPAVKTEGWSGKTVAYHYSDPASNFTFAADGNPNGTIFDFARYLSTNSFSMVADDLVYFALGTNDIGAPANDSIARHVINQMFVQLDAMMANIRAAVPNINIGIVQIIPAANVMWQRQRNRARAIYLEMINAKYGGREGERIYVIPMGHALDCDNAFPWNNRSLSPWSAQTSKSVTDTIHPVPQTTPVSDVGGYGYDQMGDALYAFAKWLWRA